MFLNSYGLNDENAINLGFEFDSYGALSLNTQTFGAALTDDFDAVKEFFLGAAEDKGFGTSFKEYIDDLNAYDGLLSTYDTNLSTRRTTLEEDKEDTIKTLDTKYATMAAQFTAYASIIAQMESSFSGLKMMIEQSAAGN
jgi:flagellar hook-associated protein 2